MQKTLENLTKAFIGESQARNRYNFYAKIAQKEGFEQIAGVFTETENQEKIHAKRLFEHIQELKKKLKKTDTISVEAESPSVYGDTASNLQAAIDGETHETKEMYPQFADQAEKDGLPHIATRLRAIATAELHHAQRYQKLLNNLKNKSVFEKQEEVWWVCRECGFMHKGKTPPTVCPACAHPQAFYQTREENY